MTRDRRVYLYAGAIFVAVALFVWMMLRPEPKVGDPAVHQRIEASTDCGDLQGEFDAADARRKAALARNNTGLAEENLSYMTTAEARMRALGC